MCIVFVMSCVASVTPNFLFRLQTLTQVEIVFLGIADDEEEANQMCQSCVLSC